MQKKLPSTLLMLALFYGLPLAIKPYLLVHPHILLLMLAATLIWLTQPAVSAEDAAKNQRSDRNSVWMIFGLSTLSVAAPVAEWAYWGLENRVHWLQGQAFWTGLGLMTAGVGLRLWAIRTLGAFFTSTVQVQSGQQVVTWGPYALVRHPSYLGAYVAVAGCAVSLGAWVGLVVALVSMAFAYYFRINAEEKTLVEAFGDTYRQYQQRSWRIVPGIW